MAGVNQFYSRYFQKWVNQREFRVSPSPYRFVDKRVKISWISNCKIENGSSSPYGVPGPGPCCICCDFQSWSRIWVEDSLLSLVSDLGVCMADLSCKILDSLLSGRLQYHRSISCDPLHNVLEFYNHMFSIGVYLGVYDFIFVGCKIPIL